MRTLSLVATGMGLIVVSMTLSMVVIIKKAIDLETPTKTTTEDKNNKERQTQENPTTAAVHEPTKDNVVQTNYTEPHDMKQDMNNN
ncbi:unnamed protein product [Ambrosiozyma monospora]|uniref:Unnamed protein product n=1 Tax=Ambrosiozyma monospora TaxID=43982 RepID=A0ACB5UDC3_AMBMO|nr:unnamed protein product [Ambrosiozyma monospora]